MTTNPISIVIIDDHPAICHGLSTVFSKQEEFAVAGVAQDAKEAIDIVSRTKPDIIILDISLGGSDGIDLIDDLKEAAPKVRVIMYTMHFNKNLVAWSLQAGAHGYMLKSDKTSELIQAVNDVFLGKIYLSSNIPSDILSELAKENK